MLSFPQEVIERIVHHADDATCRSLVTTSRNFQLAVERHTCGGSVMLRGSKLSNFLEQYHGHRIRLIRRILFLVGFPELHDSSPGS